jgi:hypothetical protein
MKLLYTLPARVNAFRFVEEDVNKRVLCVVHEQQPFPA